MAIILASLTFWSFGMYNNRGSCRQAALFLLLWLPWLFAHEPPERVAVKMLAVQQADQLELMLRVPLAAMRDLDFPVDERGFLQLAEAGPRLQDAVNLWLLNEIQLFGNGERIPGEAAGILLALPSDLSFADPVSAGRHFAGPGLAADTLIHWRQVMLDLRILFPGTRNLTLTLTARLQHLGVSTATDLLIQDQKGRTRRLSLPGSFEKLALSPAASAVFFSFVQRGLLHLAGGYDHLLFLLCLVAPVARIKSLAYIITAFTLGHSVTLAAAALGAVPDQLWFPPLVEALIALSILILAAENLLGGQLSWRWLVSAIFGLVHGFGFAFSLESDLQWSGGHLLQALLGFNLGVELGQLAIVLLVLPLLHYFRKLLPKPWLLNLLLSLLAGHAAWHWLLERAEHLSAWF